MRRYSDADEQRIRLQMRVREWTRSGLLDAAQGTRIESDLRVDVRRTGVVLRVSLALFTALAVGGTVGLAFVVLDIDGEVAGAIATALAALACMVGADLLASSYRLYRYGVEEMLAASAVVLASISAALLTAAVTSGLNGDGPLVAALAVGAAGGWAVYRRFGYQYALSAAMACAAVVPFRFRLDPPLERLLAAGVLAWAFVAARAVRLRHRDEFPGDDAGVAQAAAFAGVYLVTNLYVTFGLTDSHTPAGVSPWFRWLTWLLTWTIPAFGLWLGTREKDRPLVDVSVVLLLITLVSNKAYLGWPRPPWDPMLLGILLMVVAVSVRRWLLSGPGGERHGFTPARLLESDHDALTVIGTVSVSVQPAGDGEAHPEPSTGFGGGRSGGAGAGGSF